MKISLQSSGGFTGQRLTASMDTDELAADEASAAVIALERLLASPPDAGPTGRSQPLYRIAVNADTGMQLLELAQSQVPAELRPLVAMLLKRGSPEAPRQAPPPGVA